MRRASYLRAFGLLFGIAVLSIVVMISNEHMQSHTSALSRIFFVNSVFSDEKLESFSLHGKIQTWKQLWISKGFDQNSEIPLHIIDGFDDLSEEQYHNLVYGALNLLAVNLSYVNNVLELGSGAGAFARALLLKWPHLNVTGIDFSPALVSISNTKVDGHFIVHDLENPLPFNDLQFDFVLMWSTLFYLNMSTISSLLWEMKRVSKHGIFIGDVSDRRKRAIAESIRSETHAHLNNEFLYHTYLEPRFFIEWAAKSAFWVRVSDEDSLSKNYEQASYRFSVALGPLPSNISQTFWEIDALSVGSVCMQPPFNRDHFTLSAKFTCSFKDPFHDVSLERVSSNRQVRISGWLQGCSSSQGEISLKLFDAMKFPALFQGKGSAPLKELTSHDLKEFEIDGFIVPLNFAYAVVRCTFQNKQINFFRESLVVNTPYFIDALPSGRNIVNDTKRSVFHLQLDAISRIRLQIELPKLYSYLASLNRHETKSYEFQNLFINGQNTDPNWSAGLCNGDCESRSLFDFAKQNGYRTIYFNNYCPMYPFPRKGGQSNAGPDVILLPEINCLEGDGSFVAHCGHMEDSPSASSLVALFDIVINSVETGPIFAFGTLNDGHCEDISKLIRMEDLIIKKIQDLISSSWFQRGGVFVFGSDHGLHYWKGVSIDLNLMTPYAFLDTPMTSSHRNPPLFFLGANLTVNQRNLDAVISHYDVYKTVSSLIGKTDDFMPSENLLSEKSLLYNRTCFDLDKTARYCNCWHQCIPFFVENASSETLFSHSIQNLRRCV